MTSTVNSQIFATNNDISVLSSTISKGGSTTKKNYEAKLLLAVLFGFGLIDAIMRRGIPAV